MGNEYKSEYDRDVFIDQDALDKELVNHGELFMKWAERLADAIEERDIKKGEIEIKKAGIGNNIRSEPKDYGLEKVTDKAIDNLIILDKDLQELNKEYYICTKNINVLTAAKEEMHSRRKRIEKLVELWLGKYWSGPKIKVEKKNELDHRMRVGSKRKKI